MHEDLALRLVRDMIWSSQKTGQRHAPHPSPKLTWRAYRSPLLPPISLEINRKGLGCTCLGETHADAVQARVVFALWTWSSCRRDCSFLAIPLPYFASSALIPGPSRNRSQPVSCTSQLRIVFRIPARLSSRSSCRRSRCEPIIKSKHKPRPSRPLLPRRSPLDGEASPTRP